MRWTEPVRPGDSIRTEIEVVGVRFSRSRTDYGVVTTTTHAYNQRDQVVLRSTVNFLAPRRMPGKARARNNPQLIPRLFRAALAASLTVSALLYFLWSWRWPLVGDASLIHYIGFLIQRGWVPYAQLGDMNMPGSYLIEIAAMHIYGMGDVAWRLFDFTLLATASVSCFVVTTNLGAPSKTVPSSWVGDAAAQSGWLPGLFSASPLHPRPWSRRPR